MGINAQITLKGFSDIPRSADFVIEIQVPHSSSAAQKLLVCRLLTQMAERFAALRVWLSYTHHARIISRKT